MSEKYLTSESDDIVENRSFSGLSLVSLALAILGAFSMLYTALLPFVFAAVAVALFVLSRRKSWQLNGLSRGLAYSSLVIATFFGAWGMARRQAQTAYDLVPAKALAESFLDAIYKREREKVLVMMGVPESVVNDPPGGDPLEKIEQTKRNYEHEAAFQEIRSRTIAPKWEFVRLESESAFGPDYFLRLLYRDTAQTIPAEFSVLVYKNASKDGPIAAAKKRNKKVLEASDTEVKWLVESVASTLKVSDSK